MAVILGITGYKTFSKALSARKKERALCNKPADDIVSVYLESLVGEEVEEQEEEKKVKRTQLLKKDASRPLKKIMALVVLWVFLILIFMFKGGKGMKSILPEQIPFCDKEYWALVILQFLWLFAFGSVATKLVLGETKEKTKFGYPFVEGDVHFSPSKCPWNLEDSTSRRTFVEIFLEKGVLEMSLGDLGYA